MEIRDRRLIGFVIRVGLLVKGRSSQFFTFPRFSLSLSLSLGIVSIPRILDRYL